jgi:dTDP-glucose 4,6-dehydratase
MTFAAEPAMPPLPEADLDHVLEWTAGVWPRLEGARLFVTGGTGFFGTWLLESLARAVDLLGTRIEACVLTRRPEAFSSQNPQLVNHPAIRLHAGDVRDFAFPSGRFTHLIHAAFPSGAPPADPDETVSLVVHGTERTLEFAERAGIKHMLFISSGAVYGRSNVGRLTQADRRAVANDRTAIGLGRDVDTNRRLAFGDARTAYATGKQIAEALCRVQSARTGMSLKIARCFAFVGPRLPLDAHFAIGNFIRDALSGGPIRIRGDGTTVRSYLYAADLALWLWTMLASDRTEQVFNVGSPEPVTTAELARVVAREVAPGVEIVQESRAQSRTIVDRYVPDVTSARICLDLVPRIRLADAIRRTAGWARTAAFAEVTP